MGGRLLGRAAIAPVDDQSQKRLFAGTAAAKVEKRWQSR
jgi:hypothetical protein